MIGQLTGVVVAEGADGEILLDVNGVGYELVAPLGTLGRARGAAAHASERVTLHVHTHVREDTLSLFAFATPRDKMVFRRLLSLSNVGPKIALAVLSALPESDLARVVVAKDLARLVAIPGIGKKTAERLLLELKDKLTDVGGGPEPARPGKPGPAPASADLVASALTRMGYRPAEAERAIQNLGARVEGAPVGELIREALALLAR